MSRVLSRTSRIFVGLIFSFFSFQVLAFTATEFDTQVSSATAAETFQYDNYYTITDQSLRATIDLTEFQNFAQTFPLPADKYDRIKEFGTWVHPVTGSCLNTRAQILSRDSKAQVTTNTQCTVIQGDWQDPYTGTEFTAPKDVQIDHVVPLKNAYMTGAFEWDYNKRCLYANYLGNTFHLLSVSGQENMRKGDGAPDYYLPPNKAFSCQYIKIWLEIKYIWSLRLTPHEVQGIQSEIQENHCDPALFQVVQSDIDAQNKFIDDHKDLCKSATPVTPSAN